jgi:hypothetical protein
VTAKQNSCGTDFHAAVHSGEAVEVLRAYTGSCAGGMDEQDGLAVFGCEVSTTLPGAQTERQRATAVRWPPKDGQPQLGLNRKQPFDCKIWLRERVHWYSRMRSNV